MKSFLSFINETGLRSNSARVKLKLLLYGVVDNEELFSKYFNIFKEEHYAFDNGNWNVDKSRLVPTEIVLPGGIVSKLHIRPDSPLSLIESDGVLLVKDKEKEISEFRFLPRPNFWNHKTSSGIPIKNLAQIYGLNCLNFNIFSGCEFHVVGKPCRFCSVSSTVSKDNPIKIIKKPADLADVCKLATELDNPEFIIITGGSHLDGNIEFDAHISTIKAIAKHLPWNGRIKGNVSMMPPKDKGRLHELFDLGVDNPSFNIEVWPKKNFEYYCPGKETYVGFDNIIDSLKGLVKYYDSGFVWSNFVAGLVPVKEMKDGFYYMADNGIVPGANLYHAEVGSKVGNSIGTLDERYVYELYSYSAELYHKYNYKPFFNASVLRNSLANEFYEGLM